MKRMYSPAIFLAGPLVFVIVCASLLPVDVRAQTHTVMTGLRNPRGIVFAPDGALYVAESGCGGNTSECQIAPTPTDPSAPCVLLPNGNRVCLGLTGSISRLTNGTQERVATGFPSYSAGSQRGGNAIGPTDVSTVQTGRAYQLFTTIGLQANPALRSLVDIGPLFAQLAHVPPSAFFPNALGPGTFRADWLIADIGNYEAQQNPGSGPVDTNPYGLLTQQGERIIADAGGNSLLRVDGSGAISTLTILPSRAQGRTFNDVLIDSVPTSVVKGPDGAYYIGELTGSPFFEGAANVYRFDPGAGSLEVFHSGFKMIMDIAFDGAGNLYVRQFATGPTGVGANSGVLKRVNLAGCSAAAANDCPRTDVVLGLNMPTSVAIGPDGAAYVVNNGVSPTNGEVLRIQP